MKYLYSSGSDGETIVLLHGFISSQRYWRKLIPYLRKEGYTVLSIDLAGFGSSRRTRTANFGYEAQVEHIRTTLDRHGIKRPVIFVGHSMGALITAKFAEKYPSHVSRAILLHPPLYTDSRQAINTLYATGVLYRFLLLSRFRPIAWGLLKLLPNRISNHSAKAREESLRNIILADDNARLITKPFVRTLLVVGEFDRNIYQENLKRLDLSSASLTTKLIQSDHHSPLTMPDAISALINIFVARPHLYNTK